VSVAIAKINELSAMEEAFPVVDCGLRPFGSRVIVQIRTPKTKSKGGIYLHEETRETEKWNTQIGRIISWGPVAFKNRETLKSWPEGEWVKAGMFVRVPKYGTDMWEVPVPGREEAKALFVQTNDLSLLGEVTDDPLQVVAFIN
jgi:co-chaperonin GroES (HSP10)